MSSNEAQSEGVSTASPLVMQLIVNKELVKNKDWGMGPLMAQAAHAATAIIAETYTHPSTRAYIDPSNLKNMRKVVLQTSEPLIDVSARLETSASNDSDFPSHHLWIEEPEHVPTVLAIAPNTRPTSLKKILAKCSLLRD